MTARRSIAVAAKLPPAALTTHQEACRAAARQFHAWGANVTAIRTGGKGPAHAWKSSPDWTRQRQTPADVADLPWRNAAGVGVINGVGGMRTLDIDKCLSFDTVAAFLAGAGLPADYRHVGRSGSGNGWRVALICHEDLPDTLLDSGILSAPPRVAGAFDHVELRWKDCQTVMPPSAYTFADGTAGPGYCYAGDVPTEPPAVLTADEVIAGFLAIAELPKEEKPQPVKPYVAPAKAPARQPQKATGVRVDYKATLHRIREEICLLAEMEQRGCVIVGRRGEMIDLSGMDGDVHSNEITYTLVPSTDGPGYIGKSKSPNGKMNSSDYPRGFDVITLLKDLDHAGSTSALMKWFNPIAPRRTKREDPPTPTDIPEWQTTEATERRARDAERKRRERRDAAQRLRDVVMARADADTDMPACARKLLDIHVQLAGQRRWHRASVARQADMAGYSDRWAQKANEYLVEKEYLTRQQDNPLLTAVWTLREIGAARVATPQNAVDGVILNEADFSKRSPVLDLELDSIQSLELVNAPPTPADCAPELDTWDCADDGHDAAELAFLDDEPMVQPEPDAPILLPPNEPPTVLSVSAPDARGMCLVCWSDGSATWAKDDPESLENAEALAWAEAFLAEMSDKPFDGKVTADGDRWAQLATAYETPHDVAPRPSQRSYAKPALRAEVATWPADLFGEPVEPPEARRERETAYFKLIKKADRVYATNPGQARRLREDAARLYPDVVERLTAGDEPPFTSSPAAGRPVDQPQLFGSEVYAYGSNRPANATGTMGVSSLAGIRSP